MSYDHPKYLHEEDKHEGVGHRDGLPSSLIDDQKQIETECVGTLWDGEFATQPEWSPLEGHRVGGQWNPVVSIAHIISRLASLLMPANFAWAPSIT